MKSLSSKYLIEKYIIIVVPLIFIATTPTGTSTISLGLFGSRHQYNNSLLRERKILLIKCNFRHLQSPERNK